MKWLNGYRMRMVLIGFIFSEFLSMASVCSAVEYGWSQRADMPTPRWSHSSAVVNGKIYVIGGGSSEPTDWRNEPTEILSTVEEYDPVTNTWTRKADMPTARGWIQPSSPVVDGKIYVIGGGDDSVWDLPTVEEYDPATDTWTRKADMPTPRWCLATSAVDGKIYAIGGAPNDYIGLSTVEEYDPTTDTWTRKADMPLGVWGLCANVVNGKIYALGGRPRTHASSYVQEYDPATDTWTRKADMPVVTSQMASVVLDDKIIVIGGWLLSVSYPYTTVQMYNPETDIWTREADVPFQRAAFSASVVNNRIYAIGGTDRSHPCPATSTVYELTIKAPPPDFNSDGIVDSADMCIMVDHWGEDYSLCDIGPMPWGDGIVDVQDLIVLAEHLFEDLRIVAYWKFDETGGSIAYDSIDVNDGICHGEPLWQPTGGMIDGALQLDGIDDYVETPFVQSPADRSLSAFAWIKGGAPGQMIISQIDGTRGVGSAWLCTDPSNGRLITRLMHPPFSPLESESVITYGLWHHVGVVYDFDGLHRCLYLDGAEVAKDISPVAAVGSDGGLYIGADKTLEAATFFSGLIDDVRIYNVALSAEEIVALAQ